MGLPGFTADQSVPRVAANHRERSSPKRTREVVPAWVCTDGNRACACSGIFDCLQCVSQPGACGGKKNIACANKGGVLTCITWRSSVPAGIVPGGGAVSLG